MRLACVLALVCACGGAKTGPNPVALPTGAKSHVRTLAERKAATCRRDNLVALEPAVLTPAALVPDGGLVRNVSVRDASNGPVEVPGEALGPLQVGEPFAREHAREVSRRLWKTGQFDDIAVEAERTQDGVAIVFRVVRRRTISEVFSADGIDAAALHLQKGAYYDPVSIVSAVHAVVASQRKGGYVDASLAVSSEFSDEEHGTVDVCVHFDVGPRVTFGAFDVRGSAHAVALSAVLAREDEKNVRGNPLDEEMLARDLLVMAAWLYDHGLLAHKIEKALERHGDTLTVVLQIEDGKVFRYSTIDVRGDLVAPKADYMKLVTAKPGAVFNRSEMMKVIDALKTIHTAIGHADASVEPQVDLDAAKGTVAVIIAVHDDMKGTRAQGPKPQTGFSIVELAAGAGRGANKGDLASLNYKGSLPNGTVFDTTAGKPPFQFRLGAGGVIAGFERGVTGMKIGGKRRVTIPPELGYGPRGVPPSIPPGSTLIFDLELVALQ